jgi:hypothetical protein
MKKQIEKDHICENEHTCEYESGDAMCPECIKEGRKQEREFIIKKIKKYGGVFPEWLEGFKEVLEEK